MSFIIDPQSVSFPKIKSDLMAYVKARPDYARWKDFYESSAGVIMIELIAGMAVYQQYNAVALRRETFLAYATALSSAKAIANNLGYSAARGTNHRFELTVTPNVTTTLDKFTVVGLFGTKSVRVEQPVSLVSGVQVAIPCILGETVTEELTYASSGLSIQRFTKKDVSDSLRLFLNGTELSYSTQVLDLNNNKYVASSNAEGSVNVTYLNLDPTDTFYYNTGDILKMEALLLDTTIVTLAQVTFDYGTLDSSATTELPIPFESVEQIQRDAPLYHETQVLVRARDDYKKILLNLDETLKDVNAQDVSPLVVEVCYLRNDETILGAPAQAALVAQLDPHRPFGVQPPTISDPVTKATNIDATVTLIDGTVVTAAQVETDLRAVWDQFELKLEASLDYIEMEYLAEKALSYAKTVRVVITNGIPTTLAWNEYYKLTYNVVLA